MADRYATTEQVESLTKEIQELKEILKPMAETYVAVTKLGKWAGQGLVIISITIGIILSLGPVGRTIGQLVRKLLN